MNIYTLFYVAGAVTTGLQTVEICKRRHAEFKETLRAVLDDPAVGFSASTVEKLATATTLVAEVTGVCVCSLAWPALTAYTVVEKGVRAAARVATA